MVAVRVPVAGVGADQELFGVRQAVTVEVGIEAVDSRVKRHARVEAPEDLGGGNLGADEDVGGVEPLEDELLAFLRLAPAVVHRRHDLRLVPEEVFPAVGEGVGVGVFKRRVHAVLLALAARLRAPFRKVEAVRGSPIAPVLRGKGQLVRRLFVLAERHVARSD